MVRGLKPEEWGIPVIFTSRVIKPIMLKAPVVHEKWGIREVKHIGRLKVLTSNQTIKKIIQNGFCVCGVRTFIKNYELNETRPQLVDS